MKRFAIVITLTLIALFALTSTAQNNPTCTVPVAELDSATSTRLRNRQERVDNLKELIDEFSSSGNNIDPETVAYEITYWATMADNAEGMAADAVAFPDCPEYNTLDSTFDNLIQDMYAAGSHTHLLLARRLSDRQVERVSEMLERRIREVVIGLAVWDVTIDALNAL